MARPFSSVVDQNRRHKVARHVIAAANLAPESTAITSKHKTTMMMTSLAASRVRQEQQHKIQLSYPTIDACETRPAAEAATATTTIITPPPSPPLLLEGDEMFLSNGISHTIYRLHHNNASHHHHSNNSSEYLLKVAYDIQNARKEITLLQTRSTLCKNHTTNETVLSKILSFPLQEINNGIEKGAGTGSMTWDSSIVMSLYFGMYPEELMGNDVLELGSGVGLGGILTCVVLKNGWKKKCWTSSSGDGEEEDVTTLITLTEVNRDILEMLRYNTAVAANESNGLLESDEMHIEKMDWFDFLVGEGSTTTEDHNHSAKATSSTATTRKKKYDTIIASDCIYLSSQIKPLSETITKLLECEGKAHIFSPCNRSHVYNLIEELREEKGMSVHVDTIEIDKFRVRSNDDSVMWSSSDFGMNRLNWLIGDDSTELERQDAVSSGTAKFLHVTASFKRHYDVEKREDDGTRMSGID